MSHSASITVKAPDTSMKKTAILQDRYDHICEEFKSMDINQDNLLSKDQIYQCLKTRSKGNFDRDLCERLFETMDVNRDSQISLQEFVWGYIETENTIKNIIQETKRRIQDSEQHIKESRRKLEEAKRTEILNKEGIMENSTLNVQVIEALNIKPVIYNTANPYVELLCEKQIIETKVVQKSLSPNFNQSFVFKIFQGHEPLKVYLKHSTGYGEDKVIGTGAIMLTELADQMRQDLLIDIWNPDNDDQLTGRVHLGLVWIWSKVQYEEDIIQQWEETLKLDLEELEEAEANFTLLSQPFGALISPMKSVQPAREQKIIGHVQGHPAVPVQEVVVQFFGGHPNWDYLCFLCVNLYLLVTVFSMFFKADYLNLTVALAAFMFMISYDSKYHWILYGLCAGCVFDVMYLLVDAGHWSQDPRLKYLSLISILLSLAVKLIIIPIFFRMTQVYSN